MQPSRPRLTSIMGVARALLTTVTTDEAVEVLLAEFGWDATFQALSLLTGGDADEALLRTWEHLALAAIAKELQAGPAAPGPHEAGPAAPGPNEAAG